MKRILFLLLAFSFSIYSFEKEFTPTYLLLEEQIATENPIKVAETLKLYEKLPLASGADWGTCHSGWKGNKKSNTKGFYFYLNSTDPQNRLKIKGYTVLNNSGIRSLDGLALKGLISRRVDLDLNMTTNNIFEPTKQSVETSIAWKY